MQVKAKYYNKVFIGYTKNVSRNGLFLASGESLCVGDRFPVEFVLPDGQTKVNCHCEVIWTKEKKSGQDTSCGVGVRFVDMEDSQKRLMEEWVIRSEMQKNELAFLDEK